MKLREYGGHRSKQTNVPLLLCPLSVLHTPTPHGMAQLTRHSPPPTLPPALSLWRKTAGQYRVEFVLPLLASVSLPVKWVGARVRFDPRLAAFLGTFPKAHWLPMPFCHIATHSENFCFTGSAGGQEEGAAKPAELRGGVVPAEAAALPWLCQTLPGSGAAAWHAAPSAYLAAGSQSFFCQVAILGPLDQQLYHLSLSFLSGKWA